MTMRHSYRITKYNQRGPNGSLISPPSEWTSFGDVGTLVSEADYLAVERAFLGAIRQLCVGMGLASFRVQELEVHGFTGIHEGQQLDLDGVEHVAREVLRERLWCKLVAPGAEFHFGYDYYLYFVSSRDASVCLETISTSLTVDRYSSPYLLPDQ